VQKENALVLFPTGGECLRTRPSITFDPMSPSGGKSLTYQIPALCLDVYHCMFLLFLHDTYSFQGLTLVISPLIALMKDQVDALVNLGVKAANLDSTLDAGRASFVKEELLSGRLKMLYVAPERFAFICIFPQFYPLKSSRAD
jgi:superfamily II DNA helicase RecQ